MSIETYSRDYKEYALVGCVTGKTNGFMIMHKEQDLTLIIEEESESLQLLELWLASGIEVYESMEQYREHYPPMSRDERKARGHIFWRQHIDPSKWTEDIKAYFESDSYWEQFRKKNNL